MFLIHANASCVSLIETKGIWRLCAGLEDCVQTAGLEGSCWPKGVAKIQGESAWDWLSRPGRQKTHDLDQLLPPLASSSTGNAPRCLATPKLGAWFSSPLHPTVTKWGAAGRRDQVRFKGPITRAVPPASTARSPGGHPESPLSSWLHRGVAFPCRRRWKGWSGDAFIGGGIPDETRHGPHQSPRARWTLPGPPRESAGGLHLGG